MRLSIFLVFLLVPAFALAALPPHIAKRIQEVVRDKAETARRDAALDRTLPNADYAAANRLAAERRAASRMSAVVIGAIAESTASTADVVAAAVAALPELRDTIVRDASAAYPGFAAVIARAAGAGAPPPASASAPRGAARTAKKAATADTDAEADADPAMDEADGDNDPIEPVNRAIFEFNEWFIKLVVRPLAQGYRWLVPDGARDSVENVLHNLNSPRILANDLLQGELVRAWHTSGRFVVNSTVGIAGIFDVADMLDLPKHKEDFGQTLAVWGVGEMMYLVLPLLGPSNPRDGVGKAVDSFLDPLNLWAFNTEREYIVYARTGVDAIDFYEGIMDELDDLRETSVDYYAAIRSLYRQRRASDIGNGQSSGAGATPVLDYDLDDEEFE